MARVKQVATKPRKFMGDAMKAAGRSEKEREEGTEVENSDEETETVAERAKKERERVLLGQPSRKRRNGEGPYFETFCATKYFQAKEIKEMSGLTLSVLEKSHELQKGIMAEQNAKMDMLINILDRQEWFMKKMAQMLFGNLLGSLEILEATTGTAGLTMQRLLDQVE
ncbi:hypothetical protein GH714_023693 [Hevea brasiliensis]|uniref:Uncharacterized protein n=1 Tax=Hevea brasiliensis TaxID=3981 RepID=A0A6A6LMA1_HEVBR|nr:hypothetical protein GH714_023693 [Hevea brasiliensis]